jgi:mitochondrial import receptor subunit TOM40
MGGLLALFSRADGAKDVAPEAQQTYAQRARAAVDAWQRTLVSPGTWEGLHRDARAVSPALLLFDGAKADIAKGLGPSFQVSHAFALGSAAAPPSYALGAVHVAGSTLLHALVDSSGVLQGKALWSSASLGDGRESAASTEPKPSAKATAQAHIVPGRPGESMMQLEADAATPWGTALNAKAINPDPSDGLSGVYALSLLQSLTPRLAAGAELVGQRFPAALLARGGSPAPKGYAFEHGVNAALRYADPAGAWVFAASLQQLAAVHASYYHRAAPGVDLGAELQVLFPPNAARRDANASVSARFDFRQACVRTSVDTLGRVGMVYEERVFPGFSLLLSGELDHVRGASRFGFGVNLEN